MQQKIEIRLKICFQVEIAVSAVTECHQLLKQGKTKEAFLKSKQAIHASGELRRKHVYDLLVNLRPVPHIHQKIIKTNS